MKIDLYNRECLEKLKELPDDSVDCIVTDPPYFISFMNKGWDKEDSIASKKEFWMECLRVTKEGGYLLAFGHSRTHHRLFTAIEDGGWEIRDTVMWLYGQGFPKSLNISKAIDKMAGRVDLSCDEVKLKLKTLYDKSGKSLGKISKECGFNASGYIKSESKKPDPWTTTLPTLEKWEVISKVVGATEEEKNEVSILLVSAEREVIGSKSSGLFNGGEGNSVGGTIAASVDITIANSDKAKEWEGWGTALKPAHEPICMARKPIKGNVAENVLKWGTGGINIDACRIGNEIRTTPVHSTDKKEDTTLFGLHPTIQHERVETTEGRFPANIILDEEAGEILDKQTDSASRFFYCAKVSSKERNRGCDKNNHPTVKPIALMEYLIKLVSKEEGTILDPFMGSGSTGIAAKKLNRNFVGIEMDEGYYTIASKRIAK